MRPRLLFALLALLLAAAAPPAFELRDGDRVVLVGSTLMEREQRSGYWETALTLRYPRHRIIFRNLGWSGDTVFGEARAGFDTPREGYRRLVELTLALQPTVLLVGYGTNEAFAGPAGLPRFQQGLETLLDALAPTKARIVLLAPPRLEKRGPPLPDPDNHNSQVALYAAAVRAVAERRGHGYLDLSTQLEQLAHRPGVPLTDNGMHLTPFGYWQTTSALERGLQLPRLTAPITLNGAGKQRLTADVLPYPPPPDDAPPQCSSGRSVVVRGLPAGRHTLRVDDKPVATASAAEWARGVAVTRGPEHDQAEQLRQAILAKNELYFHRWRPQNETYLFGFRKHEQGKNAREIVQFDPLIARAEEAIARLRVPVEHTYELVPERE